MYRLHSLMLINRIVGITCNKEAQRIALSFITAVLPNFFNYVSNLAVTRCENVDDFLSDMCLF